LRKGQIVSANTLDRPTGLEEITRLVGLGARVVSDQRPEVGWVLLAAPRANEFDLEVNVGAPDAS
jgi:hypothetical protein